MRQTGLNLPTASPFTLSPISEKGFFRVKVPPSLSELRRTGSTSAQTTAGRDE